MTKFDFTRPDASDVLSPEANLVYGVGMLASRAAQIERTLCNHPGGRPENDAEHSFSLAVVAMSLAEQYYPELDSGLVAKYAIVHDMPEVYVGDTPTHDIDANGLAAKAEREQIGFKQLEEEYTPLAPSFVLLIRSYEAQADPESRYVRMLDKLMTVVIQFSDDFTTMKKAFNRTTHEAMVRTRIERFAKDYPDQQRILDLYWELARYMHDRTWPSKY